MSKLTLSMERETIERAKRFAAERGVSVSRLVAAYLDALTRSEPSDEPVTPVLSRLEGSLAGADVEQHREHLAAKYGCSDSSST